ncbi:hypothetical protein YB2330_001503 [Saitoella coloradoensis]
MSSADAKPATETKEVVTDITNPDVLTKYKNASDIAARVLVQVKELCKDGANVLEVCKKGDELLEAEIAKIYKGKAIAKGIAFPTAISPNHVVCHFSPLSSDPESSLTLKEGDLVKISLGAQIDGYAGVLADTYVVGGAEVEGKKADVLLAAHLASEAAIRMIKVGGKNWEITNAVDKIAKAFGCTPVEGMLSHQQTQNVIDAKKQIILNPSEQQKKDFATHTFEENEVYGVDILISSSEGKVRRIDARTTIMKRNGDMKYQLKMAASRKVYSEIQKKFGAFPFTIRALDDEKTARMGVIECQKHGLLTPYEVLYEKDGEYVAQFFTTIAINKNGTTKLAGPAAVDVAKLKTEKKLEDEELLKIIAAPLKASKKKNKKKAEEKTEA